MFVNYKVSLTFESKKRIADTKCNFKSLKKNDSIRQFFVQTM